MKDKENKKQSASAEGTEETAEAAVTNEQIDALNAEIEALQAQAEADRDKYLRMAAEYENYRRRSQKEREGAYADAYADALMQLIPVIDNLERAAEYGENEAKQLSDGVNMILAQFGDVLAKMGIEQYGEVGDAFDPMIHNAIMHEESEEFGESVLSAVFQKGYRKGDKIIRVAMVKVAN